MLCVLWHISGDANTSLMIEFISDNLVVLNWTLPELALSDIARNPPDDTLSNVTIQNYTLTFDLNGQRMTLLIPGSSIPSYLVADLVPNTPYLFQLTVTYQESTINEITNEPTATDRTSVVCKWGYMHVHVHVYYTCMYDYRTVYVHVHVCSQQLP